MVCILAYVLKNADTLQIPRFKVYSLQYKTSKHSSNDINVLKTDSNLNKSHGKLPNLLFCNETMLLSSYYQFLANYKVLVLYYERLIRI